MSEQEDPKVFGVNISTKDAAAAAIAQSFANAMQDQVDLIRNQNIIKTTVMGSAYAKWLTNPLMKEEYLSIIKESSIAGETKKQDPFNMVTEIMQKY